MDLKNSLELLKLQPDFSDEELQKAYRKFAKKYHPDNGITGDEERFMAIQEAYEFLLSSNQSNSINEEYSDIKRERICPICNGNGWRREKIKTVRGFVAQKVKCASCDGIGRK